MTRGITIITADEQEIRPPTPHGNTWAGTGQAGGVNRTAARPLADQPFYKRLALLGRNHLFAERAVDKSIFDVERPPAHSYIYDIELATLQRMVIHDLQHKLVAIVKRIHGYMETDEDDMKKARKLLEDYSTAIRNYDFMLEKKDKARRTWNAFVRMFSAFQAVTTRTATISCRLTPGASYSNRVTSQPSTIEQRWAC